MSRLFGVFKGLNLSDNTGILIEKYGGKGWGSFCIHFILHIPTFTKKWFDIDHGDARIYRRVWWYSRVEFRPIDRNPKWREKHAKFYFWKFACYAGIMPGKKP